MRIHVSAVSNFTPIFSSYPQIALKIVQRLYRLALITIAVPRAHKAVLQPHIHRRRGMRFKKSISLLKNTHYDCKSHKPIKRARNHRATSQSDNEFIARARRSSCHWTASHTLFVQCTIKRARLVVKFKSENCRTVEKNFTLMCGTSRFIDYVLGRCTLLV
jgi:hypothetical protein